MTELAIHDARLEQLDLEIALNFFEHVLSHSSRLWLEYRPDQKQRFQKVLFPDGVTFGADGFGTAVTNSLFGFVRQFKPENSGFGVPDGI